MSSATNFVGLFKSQDDYFRYFLHQKIACKQPLELPLLGDSTENQ